VKVTAMVTAIALASPLGARSLEAQVRQAPRDTSCVRSIPLDTVTTGGPDTAWGCIGKDTSRGPARIVDTVETVAPADSAAKSPATPSTPDDKPAKKPKTGPDRPRDRGTGQTGMPAPTNPNPGTVIPSSPRP
jgi:hypothetical protein